MAGGPPTYPSPQRWADDARTHRRRAGRRDGDDVLIVTWANGLYLSLRAARRLAGQGISCRVFDLRWLAPLPIDQIVAHADELGRVLVVDETRHSGGVGEAVLAGLVEQGYRGVAHRVAARDTFIPLGDAANLVLVSEDDIVDAALQAMGRSRR